MFLHSPDQFALESNKRQIVVAFAGTRPEAIKLAPIAIEARKSGDIDFRIVFSGQQSEMFFNTLLAFGVASDQLLGSNHTFQTREVGVMRALASAYLRRVQPDLVLVQGDTNTALACAQAAHDTSILVGHVEAGLRSGRADRPFPEEPNRRAIAQIARLHFAPCLRAQDNLRAENVLGEIIVTGNTVIDAMNMFMDRALSPVRHDILFTCHRRENFGSAATGLAEAVAKLAAQGHRILLPIHTNPAVASPLRAVLGDVSNVEIAAPLSYPEMIDTLRSVRLVISDSGGLQEECAALGTPLLLLREETERPEVVETGNCRLVGSDPNRLSGEAKAILTNHEHRKLMSRPTFPYGHGDASRNILSAIVDHRAKSPPSHSVSDTNLALTR